MNSPTRPPDPGRNSESGRDYEYRVIDVPRHVSRAQARQMMTEHAEYGHWELAQVYVYAGGHRRIWLRRRIIRVERAL